MLLALCLVVATVAHAQTAPRVKYCLLYTRDRSFSSITLRLDYGQFERKNTVQDAALATLSNQVMDMHSVPAALSYLDSQGWELVQTATMPSGPASDGSVGFLLHRKP